MDGLAIDEEIERESRERIFGKRTTSNKENGKILIHQFNAKE